MDVENSYNRWADQYDTNVNKTRDLEAVALRECLANFYFKKCLEIGCGTGKNTTWLLKKASHITAVDLSSSMLQKAKQKIDSNNVTFVQADIMQPWNFADGNYDLITFSLILEHIEDLVHVFKLASERLSPGGYLYVGELHPFKQYTGSKARFETEDGEQVVPCFVHNISDFTRAGKEHGLIPVDINEYFDDNDRSNVPRILTIIFQNPAI